MGEEGSNPTAAVAEFDRLRELDGEARDFEMENRISSAESVRAELPLSRAVLRGPVGRHLVSDRTEAFLSAYGRSGLGTADALSRRLDAITGTERPEGYLESKNGFVDPFSYLDYAASEGREQAPVESIAGDLTGLATDPVWLATYGRARAFQTGRMGGSAARAGRWGVHAKDMAVAGGAADLVRGVSRGHDGAQIREDMLLGAGLGMVFDGAGAGLGRLLRGAPRPDPTDAMRSGVREAFADADYDAYAQRQLREGAERRVDEIMEEIRVDTGDRVQLPDQAEGIRRFNARRQGTIQAQARRPQPVPKPAEAESATRRALSQMESQNQGGAVLDNPERMRAARAHMLNEPDVADEVEALVEMGMKQADAERLAVPEFQLVDGPGFKTVTTFSGFDPTLLVDPIKKAVAGGQWLRGHTVAAARWLAARGDSVSSMSQAARKLIGEFGKGIRRWVPDVWQSLGRLNKRTVSAGRTFDEPSMISRMFRRAKKVAEGGSRGLDYAIDPVVDRVRRISPRLYNRMYRYASDFHVRTEGMRARVDPHTSAARKAMDKGQQLRMKSALLNQDFDGAKIVARELSGSGREAAEAMIREGHRITNEMYHAAKDAGMDVAYLDNFWPRLIKKGREAEYRKALSGKENSAIDDALRVAAKEMGVSVNNIPDGVRRSVIAKTLAGYGPKPLDARRPAQFKQRRVQKIKDEHLHFYEDPQKSLDVYIERMSEKVSRRKLFGGTKSPDDPYLADSVAGLIDDLGIRGQDADTAKGILDSLFRSSDQQISPVVDALRNVGYAATIGQFTSALRQAGDLTATGITRGWMDTGVGLVRALSKNSDITVRDLGLDRLHEELASRTRSGKALDWLLKYTGFRETDKLMKNVHLSATFNRARRAVRSPQSKTGRRVIAEIRDEFGDDADQLLRDIASGEKSDLALVYGMSRLGEIQPITRLEVPQGYLDASNAWGGSPLLLYQLKTFAARRLGMIRRLALRDIYEGSKKIGQSGSRREGLRQAGRGVGVLGYMMGLIGVADGGITLAQDMLLGKELDPAEATTDALLQIYGLNRYTIESADRGRVIESALFPPALSVVQRGLADILNEKELHEKASLRMIPWVGNIYHNRMGGGRPRESRRGERRSVPGVPQPPRPPRPPSR